MTRISVHRMQDEQADRPPGQIVGDIVREALKDRELNDQPFSHAWFGGAVAAAEGRADAYQPANVGYWIKGAKRPSPSQLMAMERVLELTPGTLTRPFGFVSVDAVPVVDVGSAIDADPDLMPQWKRALRASWEEYRALTIEQRQKRHKGGQP